MRGISNDIVISIALLLFVLPTHTCICRAQWETCGKPGASRAMMCGEEKLKDPEEIAAMQV